MHSLNTIRHLNDEAIKRARAKAEDAEGAEQDVPTYSLADLEACRAEALEEGREEGIYLGEESGYESGYESGSESGYQYGHEEGRNEAYEELAGPDPLVTLLMAGGINPYELPEAGQRTPASTVTYEAGISAPVSKLNQTGEVNLKHQTWRRSYSTLGNSKRRIVEWQAGKSSQSSGQKRSGTRHPSPRAGRYTPKSSEGAQNRARPSIMARTTLTMLRRLLRAFLALLAIVVGTVAILLMAACISFRKNGSPDTVVDRYKTECAASGGRWTIHGCDPPLPWRAPGQSNDV